MSLRCRLLKAGVGVVFRRYPSDVSAWCYGAQQNAGSLLEDTRLRHHSIQVKKYRWGAVRQTIAFRLCVEYVVDYVDL